jgi:hypothetical protein
VKKIITFAEKINMIIAENIKELSQRIDALRRHL